MAAILLTSAAVRTARPRVTPQRQPLGATKPSTTLPLMFIVTGLLALFTGAGWLVARPEILSLYHYSPNAVAVTHLFVLGWIASVVMGAMYQLVPVALETKLFSEWLARIQFAFHAIGFAGMVWGFHVWNLRLVSWFGTLVVTGVALFVFNIARTLRRVPTWNVVATAVASAIGWISCAVSAGLFIAVSKAYCETWPALGRVLFRFDPIGAMHAHAHLGAVGFFTVLIVGISYKLVPMFTLSELQNPRRAMCSIWLLNAGLAGSFIAILLRSAWKPAFALLIAVALILYLLELRAILRTRKRRAIDWGVKYFLTAAALMLPLCVIALILSWPALPLNRWTMQLENVYGFLGLVGVVSFAIMGMLYKIVPFLVWFGTYSPHVGKVQVPALADMYSARLQSIGYGSYLTGLAVTLTAIECSSATVVRGGCVLLVVSLAVFAVNIFKILAHFVHPQLKPLPKMSLQPAAL